MRGLCANQVPASAAANKSASAALNAAGSSLVMVWPARGIDQQRRSRRGALDEQTAVETELVLVADDHQQRRDEAFEFLLHLP